MIQPAANTRGAGIMSAALHWLSKNGALLTPLRSRTEVKPYARKYRRLRSEEHTSELQSLMRISYAVFCLKQKNPLVTLTILIPLAIYELSLTLVSYRITFKQ